MLRRGAGETGSGVRGAVAERGASRRRTRRALLGAGIAWAGRRSAPPGPARRAGTGAGPPERPQDQRAARLLARGRPDNASHQARVARLADFRRPTRGQGGDGGDPGRGGQAGHRRRRGDAPDVSIFDRFRIFGASQRGIMRDCSPWPKWRGSRARPAALVLGRGVPGGQAVGPALLHGHPHGLRQRRTSSRPGSPHRAQDPGRVRPGHAPAHRRAPGEPGAGRLHPLGQQLAPLRLGLAARGDWYDAKANRVTMDDPKNIAALDWELGRAKELGATRAWRPSATPSPRTGCRTCSRPAPSAPPSTPPPS